MSNIIPSSELTLNSNNVTVESKNGSIFNVIVGKLINMFEESNESKGKVYKHIKLVICTEEEYPQKIFIDFEEKYWSKIEWLNETNWKQKDLIIQVKFNFRGIEYQKENETKYFNRYMGWEVNAVSEIQKHKETLELTKNLPKSEEIFGSPTIEPEKVPVMDLFSISKTNQNNFINIEVFLDSDNYFKYISQLKNMIKEDIEMYGGCNVIFYATEKLDKPALLNEIFTMVYPEFQSFKPLIKTNSDLVFKQQYKDNNPAINLINFIDTNGFKDFDNNFFDLSDEYLLKPWNFIPIDNI